MIEVVILAAVVSILLALALPAVQQRREAARRTHRQNQLTQIGLAIHNYQSSMSGLPPAR